MNPTIQHFSVLVLCVSGDSFAYRPQPKCTVALFTKTWTWVPPLHSVLIDALYENQQQYLWTFPHCKHRLLLFWMDFDFVYAIAYPQDANGASGTCNTWLRWDVLLPVRSGDFCIYLLWLITGNVFLSTSFCIKLYEAAAVGTGTLKITMHSRTFCKAWIEFCR